MERSSIWTKLHYYFMVYKKYKKQESYDYLNRAVAYLIIFFVSGYYS